MDQIVYTKIGINIIYSESRKNLKSFQNQIDL